MVSWEERVNRFEAITIESNVTNDYGLLKIISIDHFYFKAVEKALIRYLYANLTAYYKNKIFNVTENLLEKYSEDLLNLPNLTPNGLLLPKRENCDAYNRLHKEFAEAFYQTRIGQFIDKIQYPINVRMQYGIENPTFDQRPRASVKPHTDIWAGDPAAAIVVFLSVLGDTKKVGIRFMQPKIFPTSFVRSLENFDLGKEIVDQSKEISCILQNCNWFLMDPYMIHQTTKNGNGIRISIDLRFITKNRLDSDWMGDVERAEYFISFNKWRRIGSDYLMTTHESITQYFKKFDTDYTVGYPVNVRLIPKMK